MRTSVLKPGYLVSLKTAIRGGVTYTRRDIESEHINDDGARVAAWETSKEIPDPADYEKAVLARTAARSAVARVCAYSPAFGFLFPATTIGAEAALDEAIREARKIADEHNRDSKTSYLQISVICGRIAQDDAEAARAVGTEIRELLDQMRAGIAGADPTAIREAANRAKGLETMLSAEVAGKVSAAIIEAREAARAIVKRVSKAGERAADVVADLQIKRIDSARFSFLDLDEPAAEVEPEAPAGRGIDFEAPPPVVNAAPASARLMELF
jgi:hypothetical protein